MRDQRSITHNQIHVDAHRLHGLLSAGIRIRWDINTVTYRNYLFPFRNGRTSMGVQCRDLSSMGSIDLCRSLNLHQLDIQSTRVHDIPLPRTASHESRSVLNTGSLEVLMTVSSCRFVLRVRSDLAGRLLRFLVYSTRDEGTRHRGGFRKMREYIQKLSIQIENLFKSRAVLESEAVSSEEESTESRESSDKTKSKQGKDKSEKEESQPW